MQNIKTNTDKDRPITVLLRYNLKAVQNINTSTNEEHPTTVLPHCNLTATFPKTLYTGI